MNWLTLGINTVGCWVSGLETKGFWAGPNLLGWDHRCALMRSLTLERNGNLLPPDFRWFLNLDRFMIAIKLKKMKITSNRILLFWAVNHEKFRWFGVSIYVWTNEEFEIKLRLVPSIWILYTIHLVSEWVLYLIMYSHQKFPSKMIELTINIRYEHIRCSII